MCWQYHKKSCCSQVHSWSIKYCYECAFWSAPGSYCMPHPKSFQSNLYSCSWRFQIAEGYAVRYKGLRSGEVLLFKSTFFSMMKSPANHCKTYSYEYQCQATHKSTSYCCLETQASQPEQLNTAVRTWTAFKFLLTLLFSLLHSKDDLLKKEKWSVYTWPELLQNWNTVSKSKVRWKSQVFSSKCQLHSVLKGRITEECRTDSKETSEC